MAGKNLLQIAIGAVCLMACSNAEEVATSQDASGLAENVIAAPDAAAIKAHMTYLASDELEGREAGTPGYDAAADYVAGELAKLGVTPAGDDGTYFQTITFQRSVREPSGLGFSVKDEAGLALELEENVDYVVYGSSLSDTSAVEGEAVFVGFGVVAPELGRDDYAGLDVEGKIVLSLRGTPSGIQTEERAYYGRVKNTEASKRGALGLVSIETPTRERIYSFQRLVGEGRLQSARMTWLTQEDEPFSRAPNINATGYLSLAGARKLFEGAGKDFDAMMATAEAEGGAVETYPLPYTIALKQQSTLDRVSSANVIGLIEGSDPALKDEIIILSAHLDHIGVSKSFKDDKINNGALDNAAGVATLLDAARMIMQGERPRRSIMLLFVTAEEKGLLGSDYFAQNPTVDAENLVGLVNLDMPVLTYDFQDVVAFGAERSSIEASVRRVTEDMDLMLSPDPFPEQGLFTRSDHFSLVRVGVPSIFLKTGMANGGEEAWADHFARTYHRPADDMSNAINFDAAARFAELNTRIALQLANEDQRPLWKSGDFFARQFDGPQMEAAVVAE